MRSTKNKRIKLEIKGRQNNNNNVRHTPCHYSLGSKNLLNGLIKFNIFIK